MSPIGGNRIQKNISLENFFESSCHPEQCRGAIFGNVMLQLALQEKYLVFL